MTQQRKSICVFCGSRTGNDPAFAQAARAFGAGLAEAGLALVYGAGDRGLMGEVARAAQGAGAHVTGVIPQHLVAMEVGRSEVDDYVVTANMHERKMLMFERSDAVAVLPGGPGTLDECFEVLTWRQLGLHAKPVVLLNTAGYWNPLLALIDGAIAGGFADAGFRDFLTVEDDAQAAVATLASRLNA